MSLIFKSNNTKRGDGTASIQSSRITNVSVSIHSIVIGLDANIGIEYSIAHTVNPEKEFQQHM